MPSVTDLPYYSNPSHRTTSDVSSLASLGRTSLHLRDQCHSNPQLNTSSSLSGATATLCLPAALQQRHSTGSLAVSETPPRKGILKRPHTFNLGRERLSTCFPRAADNATSTNERNQQRKKPLSEDHREQRDRRRETAEEEDKVTTQRVEFAEKNAVAIFDDTTTDTEAGAGGATNSRKTRKNATAIVSPLVRERLTHSDSTPLEERSEESKSDEVSHIVGKWWFGRSTKFVVHCDRRGCSAGQNSREGTPGTAAAGHERPQQQKPKDPGEEQQYLTPTQRKQREIGALKKELRRSQLLCRDKERHLSQLKERLDEIERLMASSSSAQLVQCARLEQRLAERENEFIEEKEALTERHEHRMRQMNQEMSDLRTELARKEKTIEELRNVERRDRAVQVDMNAPEQFEHLQERRQSHPLGAPLSPSLVPATALGWVPPDSEKTIKYAESVPFGGEEKRMVGHQMQVPLFDIPKSTTLSTRGPSAVFQQPQKQNQSQLLATLDAYRSETVVWRTRTAQLELILQDLLLREGMNERGAATEAQLKTDGTTEPMAMGDGAIGGQTDGQLQKSDTVGTSEPSHRQRLHPPPKDSVTEGETQQQKTAQVGGECQRKECVEGRHRWGEEKRRMEEKFRLSEEQMEAMRCNLSADIEQLHSQLDALKTEHGSLVQLAETRLCEIKAIQMALNGAQAERDKLEQALAYIERRCHVMEQIGLDQGIVLVEIDEFRQAPGDVFTFRGSKSTQTMLTAKALGFSEKELDDLQIQIRSMQMAFAEDKASMSDRLKDIDKMLTMKTELVVTLTGQLENAAKNARAEDERHQRERDAFGERIEQLGRTAARVPILESELERARAEKSLCELKLRQMEMETDERMEKILAESMRNSKQNEEYWSEKCCELERRCTNLVAQLKHEKKVAEDERMGWQFSRLELDRRLHSAIEHASILNARLNCSRRDVQCDVRPRTFNKYVTCRPNQLDKGVEADLGDPQMEVLKQTLRFSESDREWMRTEMDKMGREMAERVEESQHQRCKQKKTVLPDLTVTFHRNGDIVHLNGHRLDAADGLEEEEEKTQLSAVSLPVLLDHSETSFRSIDQAQILQGHSTTENTIASTHRQDFSLQLPITENGAKYGERSHSEPTKNQMEQSQTIAADAKSVQALHERMQKLLSAILGQDSTINKSATTALRNAKLDQLFEQLGWWLRTIADGEHWHVELRRRTETMQRERDQLKEQLRNALAELEVFRTEPRWTAREQWTVKMGRSSSAEQIGHGGRPPLSERQLRRWKQIASTTFREVNQLRKQLASADTDRLSLRNRLAILRCELAMENCQRVQSKAKESRRRGSVGSLTNAHGETLASYNRWLGGDRWQSLPALDDEGMDEKQKMKMGLWQRIET